eukprot:CAMPEP_0185312310 /NCGR_PEP_ID=MMETSP1363-20130426/31183_1 /TAXON_ID=38817 /ORGANISM="Gephyrocapsa oceanica, Strain RCC1303" /LENGTH=40 /DNA_ID= /DNA_START= /DNA_END= /DNA_ORIENTATION=
MACLTATERGIRLLEQSGEAFLGGRSSALGGASALGSVWS